MSFIFTSNYTENITLKERILNVTTLLFHHHGCNNEIIEKANVAKTSFYQHFKFKEYLALNI
ncbi:TetR/AcrR family transcriptional regulator [Apibacter sp.]|uniref:TetR/AcrR family transcriptional regulator n=1 Tax=Apibacter sp. TaxID=2023709 RepID=UPI00344F94F8